MADNFWLNDAQWALIEAHLPKVHTGPERKDDRCLVSGNRGDRAIPLIPSIASILAMSKSIQVHLKNLTTFDGYRVQYFDLHEEFGFASLVERDDTVALDLNGAIIRAWPRGDQPEIWSINGSMPVM